VWTSNATDLALKGVLSLQMKISAGLTRSCYVVTVLMHIQMGTQESAGYIQYYNQWKL
jgi:hypothetical protein